MRFEGKTLEDAKANACLKLEKTLKELNIKVISEGTKGFLGIGAKPAVIEVEIRGEEKPKAKAPKVEEPKKPEVKQPERKKPAVKQETEKKPVDEKPQVKKEAPKKPEVKKPEIKKEEPKKPEVKKPEPMPKEVPAAEEKAGSEDRTSLKEKKEFTAQAELDEFLKGLFKNMDVETEITYEIDDVNRNVNVKVNANQPTLIIGKRGVALDAIQTLANNVLNHKRNGYWIKVDCDNYREKRTRTIEALALRTAAGVKRNRKKMVLDHLNANERRIIHSVLQKDKSIETFSEGKEPHRRLVIFYKGKSE